MGRPNRIRRKLTLSVSERRPDNPNETWTPGLRFATGWGLFFSAGSIHGDVDRCNGDPIQIAGFLAAKAAWDAHHHAVNWLEVG
jgi:hypothetical protein